MYNINIRYKINIYAKNSLGHTMRRQYGYNIIPSDYVLHNVIQVLVFNILCYGIYLDNLFLLDKDKIHPPLNVSEYHIKIIKCVTFN